MERQRIARGRPHVARGWREWRQRSRDGGALLPRRRRLRTSRGRIARRYSSAGFCLPPHSGRQRTSNDMSSIHFACWIIETVTPCYDIVGAQARERLGRSDYCESASVAIATSRGAGKAAAQLSAPAPSSVESRASGGAICHSRRKAAAPPGQLRASAPMAPRNSL